MGSIRTYRDLRVWQDGMQLAAKTYHIAKELPREELYGMTSQLRRCATSVPANIAEGFGRNSTKSYTHFLKTARGSLNELETHLLLAEQVDLLRPEQTAPLLTDAGSLGRMLSSLIKKIENSGEGADDGLMPDA